ncbi:MAG TPA: carboxypeptidase regulatory-like domain-containing protein [Xanthomonadaceae bacterium]|nr:carboxypeptidase regulatory-like domain-containing protein [Xanthomonadaceae bacterium]
MTKQFRVKRLAAALALVLATATPAYAQNTAAGLSGRVTTEAGEPIANAVVIIVHTPSGTTARATTDASGRYNARGLRVGGPYTVTVTREGFQGESSENVSLLLGEVAQVSFDLASTATALESIEVVGISQSQVFTPDNMGTGTNVTREQIEAFPSIQRSLQDYARLDPRITQTDKERGEISALGQNTRFNAITIDSVTTNDTFGLEANNLPLIRQPVSLDAIEEINVSVANYDVSQRGYTGAQINAVTKSGTNEFDGSVYYIYRDADWVNDEPSDFEGFDEEETYGITFGGPIIKDRLFFFLGYEKFERTAPGSTFGPQGSGASQVYSDLSVADVQEAIAIADGFGFATGGFAAPDLLNTEVEEYLAKFDWNITDYHRLSFRYTNTDQSDAILPNLDNDEFSTSAHWYNQVKEFESYVAHLYSDWSDTFSSELSVSYRDYTSAPQNFSRSPQVIVDMGSVNLHFGTEQFRHANALATETLNAFWAGNLYLGDHEVKFGFDYEDNDIFNLFLESSLGNYFFSNLDDFRNGVYRSYLFRTPASGDLNSAAANWQLENLGLFIQDSWSVSPNLTLLYGVRYDEPIVDDKPPFNAAAQTAFGFDNSQTIDGNGLFQPRFGFNYSFDTERSTQVRGGFGLFQGAAANVWLSNPFTNNGLTIDVFGCGTGGLASCGADAPPLSSDPDNQPRVGTTPAADVDFVSGDLGQPSVWKANLAFDHELPWWGLVATAEVVFFNNREAIHYEHLNLGAPTGTAPDGRLLFWNAAGYDPANWNQFGSTPSGRPRPSARANRNSGFNDVLLAKPTDEGSGHSITFQLQKPLTENWYWALGYTYQDADEVSPLTSSRAISNWNGRAVFNPNEDVSSKANYVTKDRFTGAISYRRNFFADLKTEVSMFYEGRNGKPYSYTFDNDANGDGIFGNDLLYIPTGPNDPLVTFGSATEEANFWAFVNSDPYLSSHLGQVAARNAATSPWVHNFDVRISQELPGFFADNTAEIWIDILNIGNLLNDDWGRVEEVFFPFNRGVVEYGGIDSQGRYVYRVNNPDGLGVRDRAAESRWAVQVGFRYNF